MRRTVHLLVWSMVLAGAALSAGCKSAWVSSGLIYRDQNDYAKAEEMFRTALWYNSDEAVAHYELANTLVYRAENDHLANDELDSAQIKLSQAFEHYQLAAQLKPEVYDFNPDAEEEAEQHLVEDAILSAYARMFNRGVHLIEVERFDEAITYFELAKRADPRGEASFSPTLHIAQLRYNEAQNEAQDDDATLRSILVDLEAVEITDDWENAAEKRADLTRTMARVYNALGDKLAAGRLYEELLASSPGDIALMQQVAAVRLNQSPADYSGAGQLFLEALTAAEENPDFGQDEYYMLSYQAVSAYMQGELYNNAISSVDRATEFASSNVHRAQLARSRARAHYQLNEFDLSLAAIEPVVVDGGFDPTSADAWQIYYLSLTKLQRPEAQDARVRYIALRDGTGR